MASILGRMSTAILKYPTGRYGLVGSVPGQLTEIRGSSPYPQSRAWNSEQEVIDALLSIGITKFQLADCSWYEPKPFAELADLLNQDGPDVAEVPFALTATVSKARGKQESLF